MKRRMIWILLAGIAFGGLFPKPGPPQTLDGAGTYADNDALWRVLSGDWVSADGRWTLKLEGEDGMTLFLDGETAAESALSFTYLCPEPPQATELAVRTPGLYGPGGELVSLVHQAGEHGGTLTLELLRPNGETETVTFRKTESREDDHGTF